MADGLSGMRVEHIAEDSEGCIWFATWDNGVSRFDGNEFQNFTKQDGLIDDCIILLHKTVRIAYGLVPQMASAGTTERISTI